MKYYKTSLYTYNEFLKENKTNRLSKYEKIEGSDSGTVKYLKIDEIFNREINELDFEKEDYQHSNYKDEKNTTYWFKTKSDTKYRLDLVILKEDNSDLKDIRLHNKKFISVSFSLAESDSEDYDTVTNKNEIYDLMSRIRYLIELNEFKIKNDYVFMFGKPADSKIKMYENFIKICFPDFILIKDYTSGFSNTNVGYYLFK
jgi:hypothetical protein